MIARQPPIGVTLICPLCGGPMHPGETKTVPGYKWLWCCEDKTDRCGLIMQPNGLWLVTPPSAPHAEPDPEITTEPGDVYEGRGVICSECEGTGIVEEGA